MPLFDSHAHLNLHAYDADRDQIADQLNDAGTRIINVGTNFETSRRAIELAVQYPGMYATVGLHPSHAFEEEFEVNDYIRLATAEGVVAVGECGLDYARLADLRRERNYVDSNEEETEHGQAIQPSGELIRTEDEVREMQRWLLREHVAVAEGARLPMVIHCREAFPDLIPILTETRERFPGGAIHCFSGSLADVRALLELGFYIGITGIITFDKTGKLAEVVQAIPLERLLIETDCPYLTPVPHRGERNQPAYAQFVAEKIAQIKGLSYEEVVEQTHENAVELFQVGFMGEVSEHRR